MLFLSIASVVFWSITYLLIIKRGFQDKACGMPLAALCLNISWEFLFSFVFIQNPVQRAINFAWFALDLVIVAEFLVYELRRRPADISPAFFYASFVSILATAFLTVLLVTREFENPGGYYTAFGQNLLMSILFIRMLLDRKDLAGQSLYIGAAKLIGTFCVSLVVFREIPDSALTVFFAWAILFFDLAYVALYIQKSRRLGINPLARW
jgi:hypothetical protein